MRVHRSFWDRFTVSSLLIISQAPFLSCKLSGRLSFPRNESRLGRLATMRSSQPRSAPWSFFTHPPSCILHSCILHPPSPSLSGSNHILLSFDSFPHRRFRPATGCEPLFRRPMQPRVCGVVGSQMNTRRDVLDPQGGLTPQPHRDGQFPWVLLWPADQVLRAPTKPQSFLGHEPVGLCLGGLAVVEKFQSHPGNPRKSCIVPFPRVVWRCFTPPAQPAVGHRVARAPP